MLPTGLIRLDSGMVAKHRSIEVQQRIELMFATLLDANLFRKLSAGDRERFTTTST